MNEAERDAASGEHAGERVHPTKAAYMHHFFRDVLRRHLSHPARVDPRVAVLGLDGGWNIDCTHFCQDSRVPRIWIEDLLSLLMSHLPTASWGVPLGLLGISAVT